GTTGSGAPTVQKETMTPEEEALRERYVDVDAYTSGIRGPIEAAKAEASRLDSNPIDFDNADDIIDELGKTSDKLEKVLNTLSEQIADLRNKLTECSEELRGKIEEEIEDLEQVSAYAPEFRNTYQLIAQTYDDKTQNTQNEEKIETGLTDLDSAADAILAGSQTPGAKDWPQTVSLGWGDFMDVKESFYQILKNQCEAEGSGAAGDKGAGDKEIDHANGAKEEAEKRLNEMSDATSARDINASLAQELQTGGASSEVPGVFDSFSGGLSLDALGESGTILLDKFMVATYDFGMFSSRVTGVEPPEDEGPDVEGIPAGEESDGDEGDYADYSMTKVKMSGDVNYLYGAELEYIFGGHNKSESNLNEVRNIICGVRLTMNFASTYLIPDVDNIISEISTAAMEAVAATGAGAPFAPLVKVAVSGALRAAFAAIETAEDWSMLMERESVVFLKRELGDLSAVALLEGLLGKDLKGDSSDSSKLKLSYENYLYILLYLFVDSNTLLQRTSDLITLNVNQAARQDKGPELTQLDFKMAETVTAIKATCKVKMDFVVVPQNIMELFLEGTSTDAKIEFLENHYFGYSVIRGY
ncbi:MAG: DUF5702 domain-containing protein, partial [Candidatus Gastranaerophilales bacterium]|nr:DUF5702 domain-containing protein [Candidatus Gastranaerophilales bacterium]